MYLATCYAWTLLLNYCAIRASFDAFATLYALILVDNCTLANNFDGVPWANFLAFVRKATTASLCYQNAVCRTLVAGNINYFYYCLGVGINAFVDYV